MSEWKGWAFGETALYLDRPLGAEYVGVFVQYENDVHQLGILLSEDTAREMQAWLEAALTSTGIANAELVARLRGQHG